MTDSGDRWGPPGPPGGLPPAPWRPAPPAARSRPSGPRPLLALVAGTTALTVALAGGAVVADHHKQPLATALLPGFTPPAADTSKATRQRVPVPRRAATPEPVLSVAQVADVVKPGVVVINSQLGYQNEEAAGTGMVLSSTGEILTNNHVITGATSITVTAVHRLRQYQATVVGTAASSDIAVLQLQGASGLPTIPLGDSDRVTTGQSVVAIGNAGGRGELSAVSGSVTSTDRTITASDQSGTSAERLTGMIEAQAPILAGDSGGPLASRAGKVIGMDTAASASSAGAPGAPGAPAFGFAIPINRALSIVAQIRGGDTSGGARIGGRGFLGIQVRASDPATNTGGAEIIDATPDSPAAGAGLEAGDVVTTLDGQPVTSADALTSSLARSKPGQRVTVGWTDPAGTVHSAQVTLASGPAD